MNINELKLQEESKHRMTITAAKIIIIANVDRMLMVCQAHAVSLRSFSTTLGNRHASYFVEDTERQRK